MGSYGDSVPGVAEEKRVLFLRHSRISTGEYRSMAEGESDTEDGSSSLQVEPQEEETMQLALPLVSLHPPSASE